MEYIDRIRGHSVYYDDDRLYVEDKDGDEFAAVLDLPDGIDSENPVEWLRENIPRLSGKIHHRIQRTKGEVTDESIPPGHAVARRPRQGESNVPVSTPPGEPGPPSWAGGPEKGDNHPGRGNGLEK